MYRSVLTAAAVLAWASVARGDPIDVESLGKGLTSLRVAYVNPDTKSVGYVATGLQAVDKQGKVLPGGLARIDVGKGGLITGLLSLAADDKDVTELQGRVEKAFKGYKAERVKLDVFGLWLREGDSVVWERGLAGGDASKIVVQAMVAGKGALTLDGTLVWIEKPPALKATVHFDLTKIAKSLEAKFGVNGVIPLGEWSKLTTELLKEESVRIEWSGKESKAGKELLVPIIETYLQRVLTDEKAERLPLPKAPANIPKEVAKPDPPAPGINVSVQVGYRLSKSRSFNKTEETLDLSVSQPVRRSITISQLLKVQGP